MGTLLIHAGMNKTGTTSIQQWIEDNAEALRGEGIEIARVDRTRSVPAEFSVEPYTDGAMKTTGVPQSYFGIRGPGPEREALRARVADAFIAALDEAADRFGTVLLSSEGLSLFFAREAAPFLEVFDALAQRHQVRVAYYVRPQHTALEASWRQTGFCRPESPSEVSIGRARSLYYWQTLQCVRELAPHVDFEMRPFIRGLLPDGDAVKDFVAGFLRCPHLPAESASRANVGFSLDFVNMLRAAPPGLFWQGGLGGQRLERLKRLAGGWESDVETPGAVASRETLLQWSHREFEADNQKLIRELGWDVEHLVPPPEVPRPVSLEELDEQWQTSAPEGELAVFHAALDRMLLDYGRLKRAGTLPDHLAETVR